MSYLWLVLYQSLTLESRTLFGFRFILVLKSSGCVPDLQKSELAINLEKKTWIDWLDWSDREPDL